MEAGGTAPPASRSMLDDCLDGSVADAHVAVCRHVGTGHLGIVEAGGHVHVADATENAGAYIDVGRTGHQAGTTAVAAVATGTAVAGRRHGIAGSTAAGPAATATTGGASRTGPGVDAYTSAVDHGAHLLKGDDAGGGVVGLAHGPGIATAADATAAASGTAPGAVATGAIATGAIATGAAIGSGRGIVVGVIVVDSPVGTAAYAPASGTEAAACPTVTAGAASPHRRRRGGHVLIHTVRHAGTRVGRRRRDGEGQGQQGRACDYQILSHDRSPYPVPIGLFLLARLRTGVQATSGCTLECRCPLAANITRHDACQTGPTLFQYIVL